MQRSDTPTIADSADTDSAGHQSSGHQSSGHGGSYRRFAAMIATSTVVMFALTYTNSEAWDHVRFSEERVYMSLLMGGAMALVMFGFMRGMYRKTRANMGIIAVGLVLIVGGLALSRSQVLVDDDGYMKGMIPHHSIAILTSDRADIDDLRVRSLADDIIEAQRKEIAEMDWLIDDIEANGAAETPEEAQARPVPDFNDR